MCEKVGSGECTVTSSNAEDSTGDTTALVSTSSSTGAAAASSESSTTGSSSDTGVESSTSTLDTTLPSDTGDSGTTQPIDLCGDGHIDRGESCDDGDQNGEYGKCKVDCSGPGPRCGDGALDPGEVCDDGDHVDDANDGCPSSCQGSHYLVFLSSAAFTGALAMDGVSALNVADGTCQAEAAAAQLTGTYRAWLSSAIGPAKERLNAEAIYDSVPLRLRNGEDIASDWADLSDGTLLNSISILADKTVDIDAQVWTNTTPEGISPDESASCGSWTNGLDNINGHYGLSGVVDSGWTIQVSSSNCDEQRHFYCFQTSFSSP